jgi:endonuclease/exonuclease/phosphatase family metal-dependent hydrolase
MKAGRGVSDQDVRDSQAQAIATFIQTATAGVEKEVIVAGDYNMIPGQDQSNFSQMNPNNFLIFVSDGLAGEFSHIGSSGTGNLLDSFAISRGFTSEYIAGSLRIVPMNDILGLSLIKGRRTE